MFNDVHKQSVGLIGANGFIGSAILRSLLKSGISPHALCGPMENPRPLPDGVKFVTCDFAEVDRLRSWVAGLDVVIHAAGPPSVQRSFEHAEEYVRVHVEGTSALLSACRRERVNHLVYISSAEVYGRPEANPVAETHRLQARSPYAAVKIAAEKLIEANVQSFDLSAVILRPFSIYGPRPHSDSLLCRIVSTATSGCIRVRDLRPVRDYCYVGDLATAVFEACSIEREGLRIVNIGSGEGTTVADFAQLVRDSLGLDVPIVEDASDLRPGQSEIFELVADITAAHDVLNWQPETRLQEGLRRIFSDGPGKT